MYPVSTDQRCPGMQRDRAGDSKCGKLEAEIEGWRQRPQDIRPSRIFIAGFDIAIGGQAAADEWLERVQEAVSLHAINQPLDIVGGVLSLSEVQRWARSVATNMEARTNLSSHGLVFDVGSYSLGHMFQGGRSDHRHRLCRRNPRQYEWRATFVCVWATKWIRTKPSLKAA